MILDLGAAGTWDRESRYPSRCMDLPGGPIAVLGAHPKTVAEIDRHLRTKSRLDRETIRELHARVPGIYVLIQRRGEETVVVTDPYAIVKLYWVQNAGQSLLTDDIYSFHGQPFSLDTNALQYFMVRGYTPSRHTFFREATKLEPCSLHRFAGGKLLESQGYAFVSGPPVAGDDVVAQVEDLLASCVDRYFERFDEATLCLTGGVDSSLLYTLVASCGFGDRLHVAVGRTDGLRQSRPIDGDFDVEYARRLAAENGNSVEVVHYDVTSPRVLEDFTWLRRNLFTEYAPAFGYVGLGRSLPADRVVINGQNADSVLSFGSMGSPRLRGARLSGLHGFFTRYFHFYGTDARLSPMFGAASALRWIYYRSHADAAPAEFSDESLLLGLGIHPENKFFTPGDPAFERIASPGDLGEWFTREYIAPLERAYPELGTHGLGVLLYNRTYMQGAANRSTVLTSMLQGREIGLPFTSLGILELMCRMEPDWRFAFHGKYPNIALGRERLGLPSYILDRCDPVDSDSTSLLLKRLSENKAFGPFLREMLRSANLSRYEDVLHPRLIDRLERMKTAAELADVPLLMRLAWLESTFAEFALR